MGVQPIWASTVIITVAPLSENNPVPILAAAIIFILCVVVATRLWTKRAICVPLAETYQNLILPSGATVRIPTKYVRRSDGC